MTNKLLLIGIIIVGVLWLVFHKSTVDKMMAVDDPIRVTADSGMHEFTPRRGSIVEVTDLVVPGQMNIIYTHEKSCGRCQMLYANLKQVLRDRPDVRVMKVAAMDDVGGYQFEYEGKNINAKFYPFVFIFDKDGNLLGRDIKGDDDGRKLVYSWIHAEIDRTNEKAREKWFAEKK